MKARALARRDGSKDYRLRRWIGVTVSGMTSCPCAQELLRSDAESKLVDTHKLPKGQAHRIVQDLAIGSHMQRSFGTVMVELPDRYSIDAHQLIDVVDRSMSAASYELLKRPDEMAVVRTALANPRFVEDSVRFMIRNVVRVLPDLPDSMELHFTQRNEECVHRHDVVAEQSLTMGQARREIEENHNSAAGQS
jgi:GTP cyclohydrolase-4